MEREKVLKGLAACRMDPDWAEDCRKLDCPYCGEGSCVALLANDAYRLLKALEPRVMTLEEMRENEPYWFEAPGDFVMRPVICNMYDRGDSSYLNFVWQYGNFSWKLSEYGKTWRCWTSRPTDAQREATPWESG